MATETADRSVRVTLLADKMLAKALLFAFVSAAVICGIVGVCPAQEVTDGALILELKSQLDAQAAEIRELRDRLDRQDHVFHPVSTSNDPACCGAPKIQRLPLVVEETHAPACEAKASPAFRTVKFYADYDKGFVIRPFDPEKNPFELKVEGWTQFRYHGFARDVASWTDNAGVTRPVLNRSAFDIERARLVFSGYALDQRLTYFVQLDGDTDGQHIVDFFDYWWGWEFSDRFQLQLGKRKVPASRQWLLGARRTRLIDRPMANDFFRPDRTVGVFGVGRIGDEGHYEVMVGNSYQSANLSNASSDARFTYAITNYVDPWGNFGSDLVDFAHTSDPLARVGHSFVYSPQSGAARGVPLEEAGFLRLTDGTQLTQIGALAPGVTVSEFDLYLYGLDAALKWGGWSVNAEVFLQWIEQIQGNGPLPITDLFQSGFYVEGGYFLIPKKLDFNVRYSQVNGRFGKASEYAAGLNWYPLDTSRLKVSFDVTSLDGSPLQNTSSDILVGDNGTLFRTQFQAEF